MAKRHQYLVSYTLSNADDTSFSNRYGDRYGFVRDSLPAIADRRHRLVASGIVQGPYDTQLSVILDLRSSLPFSPTTSARPEPRRLHAAICRRACCAAAAAATLDLDAVNRFRASRNLAPAGEPACPGFANLDVRLSKFFTVMPGHRFEVIAQLFNVFDRAQLQRAGQQHAARPTSARSTRSCRTSTRRRVRWSSPSAISSDGGSYRSA